LPSSARNTDAAALDDPSFEVAEDDLRVQPGAAHASLRGAADMLATSLKP
jgi:hypothetical protein